MKLKRWAIGLVATISLLVAVIVPGSVTPARAVDLPGVGNILNNSPLGGLAGGSGSQTSVSSCAYENVGWILCPVIVATAKAADYAFSFITQTLAQFEIGIFKPGSGAAQAVAVVRNVANVLFILILLVIIYSFITGRGVGNYNLKRIAPRLVVAVILIQVSFYICQVFVDVTNVIGSTVQTQLTAVAKQIGPSAMPITKPGESELILSSVAANVMSKDAIAWQLLAPLVAVVMPAAIICSILIVVLIIRKTLVVALVLFSPIAFALYLLPGTSDYFSKWLRMFIVTLMLFPVIAFLTGAGQIVSASILKIGANDYSVKDDKIYISTSTGGEQSATLYLVAAGAAVLPLVGTWYAFRGAMGALDAAGAKMSQQGSRRSSRERTEDTKKREQAAMDMSKKSMMLRGINRLQQLNVASNGESAGSLLGRVGIRGRGKNQTKSPEQAHFDEQVQQRLNQMRSGDSGLSPQEMYAQALQKYQDKMGDIGDGGLNINSYEGIELKASEAYLLESLGKGGATSIGALAIATDDGKSKDKYDYKENKEDKKSSGGSSSGGGGGGNNGSGANQQSDSYRPPTSQTQGAQVIVVQGGQAPGAGNTTAGVTGENAAANGTGFVARRPVQGSNELLAKTRAAKYMADSQGALTPDDDMLGTATQQDTPNDTQPGGQ